MKASSGKSTIGFISPSDGWHNAVIIQGVGYTKKKDEEGKPTGEASEILMIPLQVIEDSDEGAVAYAFCNLKNKSGKKSLAEIIHKTGISKKIAQKKGWPDIDSEDADKFWQDSLFESDSKLVWDIVVKLPEHTLRFKSKTTTSGEGDKKRTNTRIVEIDFYDGKGGKKGEAVEQVSEDENLEDGGGFD